MKKLNSREGTTILGAAVADDILSVILLSFISNSSTSSNLVLTLLLQLAFFLLLFIAIKWLVAKLMKWSEIFQIQVSEILMALILCFGLSYLAALMGLSDVIGAFFAGIAIGQTSYKKRIIDGIKPIGYGLFIPVFFCQHRFRFDFQRNH